MSDFDNLQHFPAEIHICIASLKSGYLMEHSSCGVLAFKDNPRPWGYDK